MKRIERLTAIITFLQSRKYTSIKRLKGKFGVSDRTIYRDFSSLHEIGVLVSFEPGKGYFILDSHFIPPVSFSENEAVALTLAGTLMKRFSDHKTNEHFESALEKVRYALDSKQKDTVATIEENTATYLSSENSRKGNYLFEVHNAMIKHHILKIKYKDRKEQITEREIEPIGLSFYSGEWHVVAFCWLRKAYRDFIISSILRLDNLRINFKKENHINLEGYIKQLL